LRDREYQFSIPETRAHTSPDGGAPAVEQADDDDPAAGTLL
jgi:hypothetical protein